MSNSEKQSIIETIAETLHMVKPGLPDQILPSGHLLDDYGLESLDMVELVARIEEKFQTPIGDDDYRRLYTVDKIADYILEHQPAIREMNSR